MEFSVKLLIFIILIIIHILLDKSINKCKTIIGKLLLFIHHIAGVYIWLGSIFFGNYLFHFLFVFVSLILYLINDYQCFLTDWQNKFCKFDDKEVFMTWLNIIFKEDIRTIRMVNIFLLIVVLSYDLYFINKEYKFIKL